MGDLFFGSPFRRLFHARHFAPELAAMDWIETPTSHVLRINVPGLGKDDVKVQVEDGNVLSVRGAPPPEKEGKEVVWHVAERGRPEFAREVALPADVRVEQVRASVDNGVLTVVVPKEPAPARPRPRPIAVSSKL
ncbi:hypothetical protein GUJ93_ZPchr0012g19313 [Zizania palustris]|uniref:SHSP domain-containing protein n=1 Tax=Zizania palustris TaxID=103762 RepID=A0A8J6BYB3_ZIZPA|nr:hypothetical protein GUJ93_ZPchr0012g19313 [Zizania palustris]